MSEAVAPAARVEIGSGQRFGPVIRGDGVCFQIWAPAAQSVGLEINGRPSGNLERVAEGYWQAVRTVRPGARYRYVVDGVHMPDPASRFQPDDVNGDSVVVDASSYRWKNRSWRGRPWAHTVLYEVHVGVMGGFAGVISQLARLAALGITAIELMPIADFAGARNWGYDGVMPFAPDSSYGTPDDLRALVDEAHGLGLMVFLDVVYNHFGPEGNYLSSYAPEFFDEATQTPWGAAIDFANAHVRRFFIENALYWLDEFQIDGLRLDAVHAIKSRDWLIEMARAVRSEFPGRFIHLTLENENNDAALLGEGFDAQWNDDFHNVVHVLLTGEHHAYYRDFAEQPAQRLAKCLSQGFIYQGEPSLNHDGTPRGQPSGHLPPTAFIAFVQNHDQVGNRAFGDRLTTMVSKPALKSALALLLLSPQIPMLFMGEEYGAREPFLFFTDFTGELGKAVRDGRRREFAHTPGFSEEGDEDRIPDPNDHDTFAASRFSGSADDADEWYEHIRNLLELRHNRIMPFLADTMAMAARAVTDSCVSAEWRLGRAGTLRIVANFGASEVPVRMPDEPPIFGDRASQAQIAPYTTLVWITP
jgi:maltooligosyltrehalose trehalohydrolase